LLAHNSSKRVPAIARPAQDERLGALSFIFLEDERDACRVYREAGLKKLGNGRENFTLDDEDAAT
jgi:hypothetical protein